MWMANRLVDNSRYDQVLLSDYKRFSEEFAAAGESSRDAVVEIYKSLVCERVKV